jgi:hypothetical protein
MVKVLSGQSLFDIAVQYTGIANTAIDIAKANGIDVTDKLTAGMTVVIPENIATDRQTVDYYTARNITPATDAQNDIESARIFGVEFPEQFS